MRIDKDNMPVILTREDLLNEFFDLKNEDIFIQHFNINAKVNYLKSKAVIFTDGETGYARYIKLIQEDVG